MPAQLGQDLFVLEVLGGLHGGFFLDSGAADGICVSNTRLLEQSYGWSGICVEPNERFFDRLVRNRRCFCVNCCLYDREGTVEFLEAGTLGGIFQEYHPAHLNFVTSYAQLACSADGRPHTVRRTARTIRSVLRECAAPRVIDYWSLDTEGSELALLRSFPFDEYAFRVLTVEHNRLPVRQEIKIFLESRGYRRVRDFDIDDGYLWGGESPRSSWRSAAWSVRHRGR